MTEPRQPITESSIPTGLAVLQDPVLNKGTAFSERERDALGLRGLLPPRVHSMDLQVERILDNLRGQPTDLDKYILLTALHDRNEALFFRVVMDNAEEMMPIIYTPTVGLGCQLYGRIYRRARGMFVSADDRGRVEEVLRNWPYQAGIIVVTDGERILGLGDLGAQGMGIPVGKLSLYTACAGVHPSLCLPVTLDVGTDNVQLRDDHYYIGLARPRLRGAEYDAFVDEFITAARTVFPGVLIQFEDFANANAFRLLRKYRDSICTFNDDIQGTASVALAGVYSAMRITGGALTDQKILFLGAGEAAIGIADLVVAAMVEEGLTEAEARTHCSLVDSKGLVVASRTDLTAHKARYACDHAPVGDFLSAVQALQPHAIIGVAAVGKTFTKDVIGAMSSFNERPIIFALSNPTSKAECTAEEAYAWSHGSAVFACGSPFPPVTLDGRTHVPRQGNNSYVFPGVGLGVIACKAERVTDEMFLAAARTLASLVTEPDLAQGSIYPSLARMREVSAAIGASVADVAFARGLATVPKPADTLEFIRAQMYNPAYTEFA